MVIYSLIALLPTSPYSIVCVLDKWSSKTVFRLLFCAAKLNEKSQ